MITSKLLWKCNEEPKSPEEQYVSHGVEDLLILGRNQIRIVTDLLTLILLTGSCVLKGHPTFEMYRELGYTMPECRLCGKGVERKLPHTQYPMLQGSK
ncbi:hypothetical protein NQ317_003477 [Molorchus minor]|uniref:Uncharacterized protein n=1 Tax=Molorchus minor TaxID=1323400 RepID=A0ABQ9JZC5_9CUCU|nr:hypothetical protein NQ317_003477 [Molorchus minor]